MKKFVAFSAIVTIPNDEDDGFFDKSLNPRQMTLIASKCLDHFSAIMAKLTGGEGHIVSEQEGLSRLGLQNRAKTKN